MQEQQAGGRIRSSSTILKPAPAKVIIVAAESLTQSCPRRTLSSLPQPCHARGTIALRCAGSSELEPKFLTLHLRGVAPSEPTAALTLTLVSHRVAGSGTLALWMLS